MRAILEIMTVPKRIHVVEDRVVCSSPVMTLYVVDGWDGERIIVHTSFVISLRCMNRDVGTAGLTGRRGACSWSIFTVRVSCCYAFVVGSIN